VRAAGAAGGGGWARVFGAPVLKCGGWGCGAHLSARMIGRVYVGRAHGAEGGGADRGVRDSETEDWIRCASGSVWPVLLRRCKARMCVSR